MLQLKAIVASLTHMLCGVFSINQRHENRFGQMPSLISRVQTWEALVIMCSDTMCSECSICTNGQRFHRIGVRNGEGGIELYSWKVQQGDILRLDNVYKYTSNGKFVGVDSGERNEWTWLGMLFFCSHRSSLFVSLLNVVFVFDACVDVGVFVCVCVLCMSCVNVNISQ